MSEPTNPHQQTASRRPSPAAAPSPQTINELLGHFKAGRYAKAEPIATLITQLYPLHGFGWKALGAILKQLGRQADALAPMLQAAALAPDDAETHFNLGSTLQELDRFAQAAVSYRVALKLRPQHVQTLNNLGITLQALGRPGEAESCYRQALRIDPDHAASCINLGNALLALGRITDAHASYLRALQIDPMLAPGHYNLGETLNQLGQLALAEASYLRAIVVKPDYADAHSNLGSIFVRQGRLDEAEARFRRALELVPNYPEAHSNLGNVLKDRGLLDEAEQSYRRALELKPDYADAHSNMLFTLNYHPQKSGEQIFAAYQGFEQQFGQPHRMSWRAHDNPRTPHRLKVGYVSPALRQHSSRHFLEPLLAQHDHGAVEVYAYAELAREDAVTARYKTYVDHWVPTRGMSDEALAQRIRDDGIDILVDVAGHTAGNRLQVFARKPAPVSLHWLDFGYTTGLSAIDYYLTDCPTVPAGSEALFSETPWRLDGPGLVYRPAEGMGEVSALPAADKGHLTFGSLTRAVRINHHTVRVWAQILQQVPNARLVIDSGDYRTTSMQDALAERLAQHGIARERLSIGYHSPPWDVLRQIDIALDCFPHNSGTTLFESLYLGVPFVTLAGRPSVGTLGSAILHGVGHPEWIAHTEGEYINTALALAADLPKLAATRASLGAEMQASPLMDEAGFTRRVEAAYRGMFEQWLNSEPAGGLGNLRVSGVTVHDPNGASATPG